MGRQLTIQVHEAKRKQIIREDGVLHIYTTETEQSKIDKQVNNWWQQAAKRYYQDIVDRLYPIIEKHGLEKPSVCVKKMTTLWGSCSRKNQNVNLNYYLYKAVFPVLNMSFCMSWHIFCIRTTIKISMILLRSICLTGRNGRSNLITNLC